MLLLCAGDSSANGFQANFVAAFQLRMFKTCQFGRRIWTGVFVNNKQNIDKSVKWQYFASQTGFFKIFPGKPLAIVQFFALSCIDFI